MLNKLKTINPNNTLPSLGHTNMKMVKQNISKAKVYLRYVKSHASKLREDHLRFCAKLTVLDGNLKHA